MRVRTALLGLVLVAPLGSLTAGTAHAEPYLPPGAAVPATGTITIEGQAAAVPVAAAVPSAAVVPAAAPVRRAAVPRSRHAARLPRHR